MLLVTAIYLMLPAGFFAEAISLAIPVGMGKAHSSIRIRTRDAILPNNAHKRHNA